MILKRELIKQRRLRVLIQSDHHKYSRSIEELNQPTVSQSSKSFSTWRNQNQRSTVPVILDVHVIEKETAQWNILPVWMCLWRRRTSV
ncbi:MAG: hypothetical protein AB8B71_03555, partial [Paracoccaceae bacterium]